VPVLFHFFSQVKVHAADRSFVSEAGIAHLPQEAPKELGSSKEKISGLGNEL
jgi:hypothetical protein